MVEYIQKNKYGSLRFLGEARFRGMTLLEVLMAIAIFSFTIIPIITIYRQATLTNLKSVNALHASNLALSKLEEYKFGGVSMPENAASDRRKWGEYQRLYQLLKAESESGTGWVAARPNWKIYERFEDYDTIPFFPNFTRLVKISFFPEVSPDPQKYPENIMTQEYIRLLSRIQIYIEVRWTEAELERHDEKLEKKYYLYTIVTNKMY